MTRQLPSKKTNVPLGQVSARRLASALFAAATALTALTIFSAATTASGVTASATTVGGTRVGLVDSIYYSSDVKDETSSAPWLGLHTGLARIAVPFDIATRPTTDPFRATFDSWLQGVVSSGAQPYVTFMAVNPPQSTGWTSFYDNWNSNLAQTAGAGHCYAYSNGETHCSVPSLSVYTAAVDQFVSTYTSVNVIGAWNEPDYNYNPKSNGGTGRRYYTPDDQYYMYTADCGDHPGTNSCGPNLAANYWLAVKNAFSARGCSTPTCLTVAGEFSASQPADSGAANYGYFGSYAYYLRALHWQPYIWATHPYGEARRGDATTTATILSGGTSGANYLGPDSPMYRTNELPAVNGTYPTSHLWDSAAGVPFDSTVLPSGSSSCTSAEQQQGCWPCPTAEQGARLGCWASAVRYLNSASGPTYSRGRAPRVYIYDYRNGSCSGSGLNDVALVCPGNPNTPNNVTERHAYDVVAQQIAAGGN